MLNLWHVAAFLAVAETGSFHEASRRLGVAQPTVSLHVRSLEEALGATLIVRGRARSIPSTDGRRFLPHARSLMAVADRARRTIAGRHVGIGASSNIGIYLLQPHLKRIAELEGGRVRFELGIGPNPDIVAKLETGEIDIAVLEWWDDRPGFVARRWRRERLVIIVSPDHAWAGRAGVTVEELATQPLLGGEPGTGTGTLLRRALGDAAELLRVDRALGSTEAVKHAVRAGLGVSLVAESSVAEEVRHGTLAAVSLDGVTLEKDLQVVLPAALPDGSAPARIAGLLLA
ncbi:LysR family transcriptional regulator (plasmid) [Skermanella mucosa]|uniref:LysR family transcriptional regulator n=1 Tax=Skermanella mucosa TaxID=1789672 RepID=UPI00192AFF51|nr:LysR family transcriptional regulator [Skermanella mucosa]UEM24219.1 LysR family transcriptional regulator [Skermanella mucosa]